MLFDKRAFKNVICAGHILDGKGEKMSKSKGNIIKPKEIIDSVGVDAVRMQMCINDPGNSKRFSLEMIRESVLPFLNVLYNCKTYYSQLEENKLNERIEDKWILSKLNNLVKESTEFMNSFEIDKAMDKIINFTVNDLSRTYIRMTRDRTDTKDILKEILKKVSLLLSPFAPYISESIYQLFEKGDSVHLSKWPEFENKKINNALEKEFLNALEIIEKGLKSRDKNQRGLKWPLAKATIGTLNEPRKEIKSIILSQLNVKSLEFKKSDELSVELDFNLNSELEAEGFAREISRQVQSFRKELGFEKKDKIKLGIITDKNFGNVLSQNKNFIEERTNSKELIISENKISKSKNEKEFKIKGKIGKILIY